MTRRPRQYAVITATGFAVRRSKPRVVADLRHRDASVTIDDVQDAIYRLYGKRCQPPSVVRVTRRGQAALKVEAANLPGIDYDPTGKLVIMGVKVTL